MRSYLLAIILGSFSLLSFTKSFETEDAHFISIGPIINSSLRLGLHYSHTAEKFVDHIWYDRQNGSINHIVEESNNNNKEISDLAFEQLNKANSDSNKILIGSSVIFALLLIGFLIYKRKRDGIVIELQQELNAKLTDIELITLRSQINIHFLFTSLNSINDFLAKNDSQSAKKYFKTFSRMVSKVIESSAENEITLKEDLVMLDLYLQIESLRLHNKFQYTICVDRSLNTNKTLLPPFILQPIIENSIWHGISNKQDLGHIYVEIKKVDDMMVCAIEDDRIGLKESNKNKNRDKSSFGVQVAKNRIALMNRIKKSKGTLSVIDRVEGLRVEVKLPLKLCVN